MRKSPVRVSRAGWPVWSRGDAARVNFRRRDGDRREELAKACSAMRGVTLTPDSIQPTPDADAVKRSTGGALRREHKQARPPMKERSLRFLQHTAGGARVGQVGESRQGSEDCLDLLQPRSSHGGAGAGGCLEGGAQRRPPFAPEEMRAGAMRSGWL